MIGKKLREYRGKLRLTGTTLAKLAGINQPYLSEIENEKSTAIRYFYEFSERYF